MRRNQLSAGMEVGVSSRTNWSPTSLVKWTVVDTTPVRSCSWNTVANAVKCTRTYTGRRYDHQTGTYVEREYTDTQNIPLAHVRCAWSEVAERVAQIERDRAALRAEQERQNELYRQQRAAEAAAAEQRRAERRQRIELVNEGLRAVGNAYRVDEITREDNMGRATVTIPLDALMQVVNMARQNKGV